MKAYKVEVLIVDHYGLTADAVKAEFENANYGNDCMSPEVMKITEKDIGEWHDDHPLNSKSKTEEYYNNLF